MEGTIYGYARVSSRDQNLSRQFQALEDFGVKHRNIFADKASGCDFDRPEWRVINGIKPSSTLLLLL